MSKTITESRRDYVRNYQREWRRNRRAEYFSGKSCSKCGSRDSLELHHQDPSIKASHNIWSWSDERRAAELEKCEILCSHCHKTETASQRIGDHGKISMYNKRGCRCDLCRAVKSEANKRRIRVMS